MWLFSEQKQDVGARNAMIAGSFAARGVSFTVRCQKYSHMARAQQPIISARRQMSSSGWLNKVGPH